MEREPNTQYVLSLSYGKDSIACLEAIKQLGYPLDRIIHAEVWFDDETSADLPPMLEFKSKADAIIKERYGIEVEHVCAMKNWKKYTYLDGFYHIPKRKNKDKDGKIEGYPPPDSNRLLVQDTQTNRTQQSDSRTQGSTGITGWDGATNSRGTESNPLSEYKGFPLIRGGGARTDSNERNCTGSTITGKSVASSESSRQTDAEQINREQCKECPDVKSCEYMSENIGLNKGFPVSCGGVLQGSQTGSNTAWEKHGSVCKSQRYRADRFHSGTKHGFPAVNRWCTGILKDDAMRKLRELGISKAQPGEGGGWCKGIKTDTIHGSFSGERSEDSSDRVQTNAPQSSRQEQRNSPFSKKPEERRAKINTVQYFGIAADEPERIERHQKKGVILPLVDIGWDEAYCRKWCEENDLLSPTYTTATRGGCWFCHCQSIGQLRLLRKNYPHLWQKLLDIDYDSPVTFHADGRTVHDIDRRFQLEEQGLVPIGKGFRWEMLEEGKAFRQMGLEDFL